MEKRSSELKAKQQELEKRAQKVMEKRALV